MALKDLRNTFAAAKKVWQKDKKNKEAKKAFKAAKAAYMAAKEENPQKRSAENATSGSPQKKQKKVPTYAQLRQTAKNAKAAWKVDKKNPELRAAFRAAKDALAAAKDSGSAPPKKKHKAPGEEEKKKPQKKCYVGNLSFDIDEDQLREFFAPAKIKEILWLTDRQTKKFRGMGFITFESIKEAMLGVEKNGEMLMDREVRINYAYPKREHEDRDPVATRAKPEGCDTIFAGNVAYDIDDAEVRKFFKGCGKIAEIRWMTDPRTQRFKGAGFIQFEDTAAINKAVLLDGKKLCGRQIRIDYAAPRRKDQKE